MGLLLLINDDKSYYVYMKDFNRPMFHKRNNKNKKRFCKSLFTKHKELSINGKQSVKLEKGTIEFEDYFKQIPVSFNIYADFECNLRGAESYEGSYTKNIKIKFLVVLLTKMFVLRIGLLNQLLFLEVKMLLMNLLKELRNYFRKLI